MTQTRQNKLPRNVSQAPLNDRIYQSVKWSLIIGEYFPGSVLSIRSLAKKMGTSTMPVREALTRLASERLLLSSVKRSYKVAELDSKRVSDQFFLRARLEGIATELAVPNLTATQIDELETLAHMMEVDIEGGSNENYIVRNYNFHFSIYAASQNEELFWSIERLWAQTGPYLAQVVRSQNMPDEWQVLHNEIAKAIRARNADKAARLIEKDISWGVSTFAAYTRTEQTKI
ncbi:MAG: GntR family transcriptional regulator [Gammaproteobacteria bacterium]|nr:GntR family transcriptional regulator [Gammaproteobacteria bacterium]